MIIQKALFVLLALCALIWGQSDPLAGRPFPETRLGVGARAIAMGGAHTAFIDQTTVTAYWNPAMAVMLTDKRNATLSFRLLSLGRKEGSAGLSLKIPPRGALSLAIVYHGDGGIPVYDSDGELLYSNGGFSSLSAYIGFAYLLTRKFSLGLATVIRSSSISANQDESISSWEIGSLFVSALYKVSSALSLGVHLREIASFSRYEAPTYGSELNTIISDGVPLNLRFGAAWNGSIGKKRVRLSADGDFFFVPGTVKKENSPDWSSVEVVKEYCSGAELFLYENFPIRLGFSSENWLSFGFGLFSQNGDYKGARIDYSFSGENNSSGFNHGLSISVPF